jgi:glycosyltransferase involved in cell wall biosynthesis
MKIGLGLITCNRPHFFKNAYQSLWEPALTEEGVNYILTVDELVVVNDGEDIPVIPYTDPDNQTLDLQHDLATHKNIYYIKNKKNLGVGKSKNIALKKLLNLNCDYIFLMEDDMYIKNPNIFNQYIHAYETTGIHHFMFGYHGPANKNGISGGNPHPRKIIDYGNDLKIALNLHCVGAFCFYTKECLEKIGLYDENYINAYEHVDHSYKLAKEKYCTPYWWWPDLANSCEYIEEQACSEHNSAITPRPDWQQNIRNAWLYFEKKHGTGPTRVPDTKLENILKYLKNAKFKN